MSPCPLSDSIPATKVCLQARTVYSTENCHRSSVLDCDLVVILSQPKHAGQYYEQYYVVLNITQGAASVCSALVLIDTHLIPTMFLAPHSTQLHRHSIPAFIDMDKLSPLISTNIKSFTSQIASLLNAYVARRQQVVCACFSTSLCFHL
jgi:hypothetical protein